MEKFKSAKPDGNGRHRRGLREKTVESEVDRNRVVRTWLVYREMLLHSKDIKDSERVWVLVRAWVQWRAHVGDILPFDVCISHTLEDDVPPVEFASTSFLPGPWVGTPVAFKPVGLIVRRRPSASSKLTIEVEDHERLA